MTSQYSALDVFSSIQSKDHLNLGQIVDSVLADKLVGALAQKKVEVAQNYFNTESFKDDEEKAEKDLEKADKEADEEGATTKGKKHSKKEDKGDKAADDAMFGEVEKAVRKADK